MSLKRTKAVELLMSKLDDVKVFFEQMKEDKELTFQNRSEKWQESEKGEEAQENIDALDELNEELQEVYDKMEDLFEE